MIEEKVLRHVVLFKFIDGVNEESIARIEAAFMELKNKISQIVSIEWGTNVSPEGLSQDFTHCFFVTFHSEADRDAYLPHPDHQAFGSLLSPYLEKVLVVDYWAIHS
jgi:hypothetical protein